MIQSKRKGPTYRHCLVPLLALFATAQAQVVNIDFMGGSGDSVHSGPDGILSSGGTYWNGFAFEDRQQKLVLYDEHGVASGLTLTNAGYWAMAEVSPYHYTADPNTLQDRGWFVFVFGISMILEGCDPERVYDVALYKTFGWFAPPSIGSQYCDSGISATYSLPGVAGGDFCLFTNIAPTLISPGLYGITITIPPGIYDPMDPGGYTDGNFLAGLQVWGRYAPIIESIAVTNGLANVHLSKLASAHTTHLQLNTNLLQSGDWQPVATFLSSSPSTNIQLALPSHHFGAFRVKIDEP